MATDDYFAATPEKTQPWAKYAYLNGCKTAYIDAKSVYQIPSYMSTPYNNHAKRMIFYGTIL
ncbi:MAG TPA: hypothetical protein DCZ61_08345 [Lachnospiraceae bacterium]|nr:hypothetical protein [Lachnospiraceae bacterium]